MQIWRRYNKTLITNVAPHYVIKDSVSDIKVLVKKSKVFLARWTTDFDKSNKTEFWYVINDLNSGIDDYSTNTRSKIRRGLKKLEVKMITKADILNSGYIVYKKSFSRYRSFHKPLDKSSFISYILKLDGNRDFWGVFLKGTNNLVAFSQNKIYDNCCDYDEIRFSPEYLKLYTSYALFYTMNQFYLNKLKFRYVNDGARSIAHNTNIQSFLIKKFRFRKAYCDLHIVYSFKFGVFLNTFYIFRKLIGLFNIEVFLKLKTVLNQEHIRRSFENR
jgi:hypothetical protein